MFKYTANLKVSQNTLTWSDEMTRGTLEERDDTKTHQAYKQGHWQSAEYYTQKMADSKKISKSNCTLCKWLKEEMQRRNWIKLKCLTSRIIDGGCWMFENWAFSCSRFSFVSLITCWTVLTCKEKKENPWRQVCSTLESQTSNHNTTARKTWAVNSSAWHKQKPFQSSGNWI